MRWLRLDEYKEVLRNGDTMGFFARCIASLFIE